MARPLDEEWSLILRRVRSQNCVPFLGAGASLGFGGGPGLPTGAELAQSLATKCHYPCDNCADLLRVAQYYEIVNDPHDLRDSIRNLILKPGAGPSLVHRTLAALPFRIVLTTNFDGLMERAFHDAGKAPQVTFYERYGDRKEPEVPTPEKPLVYKLHGTIDKLDSMVVTEDDIVEFAACLMFGDPPVPELIRGLFEADSFLFIGYGLKDWNVRVMLRAFREKRRRRLPADSFAVQRRPEDEGLAKEWDRTVMFWKDSERLRCYDIDAVEFVTELQHRFDAGEGT